MYDPSEDTYHLFYQWHPEHFNWGNISWGHAVSKNMYSWTDVTGWQGSDALALGPAGNGTYNGLGIFSGTAQPVNLQGQQDGTLLAMYTSVSRLPISWNTYYQPGSETQSIAISHDHGVTWEEYAGNPVIAHPPEGWNVTGWRDPFLEPFPALDAVLNQAEPHYYAVFGSGIRGVGPRMPLYSAPASNLSDWTFLGALWEPADNTTLASYLSTGSYAFNFEVSGFFSLPDSQGDLHYYVNMGTEGGNVSFHPSAHWALWNEGELIKRENGSVTFNPVAGGAGDWGLSYALTSFNDTKHNRRVQWAWAPEDLVGDDGLFSAPQQGFQGSHTFPRELFVHEVSGIRNPDGGLTESGNARLTQHADGTFTASTLGVRPLPDVMAGLQAGSNSSVIKASSQKSSSALHSGSSSMRLKASISNFSGGQVGFTIAASPDKEEYTNIYYDPSNYTLNVDRTRSSTIVEFNNVTVVGFFYPYTVTSATSHGTSYTGPYGAGGYGGRGSNSSAASKEPLDFDIILDGSLLEVYVNERFVLTTRIYPSRTDSTSVGTFIGEGASADVSDILIWTGLANAWPERPANSSSPLVFDTAAETNNYTWWTGN
jgi:beta-fructofuranosidase